MPTRKPPFSYSLIGLLPRSTQQILQKGFCHPLFAPIKRASRTQHRDEDESSIAKYQKYPLRVTARSEAGLLQRVSLKWNSFNVNPIIVGLLS